MPMRAAGRTEALRAGLAWLYDVEQPDGAIDQHHGQTVAVPDAGRTYGFCPRGWERRVVVSVGAPGHTPLRDGEADQLADVLADMGHDVVARWNGEPGQSTASYALGRAAHPSLLAAVHRYLSGCPDHTGPLCSWDGCPWFGDGNRLLVRPAVLPAST